MTIDVGAGLVGGALIGVSSALFLLLAGRTAGISGLLGGMLQPRAPAFGWQLLFLAGIAAGAAFIAADILPTATARSVTITSSMPTLIFAGLCVGFGTRIARGCTSGHGVCGLARFSRRSFAAVGTFFVSALVTTWLVHG